MEEKKYYSPSGRLIARPWEVEEKLEKLRMNIKGLQHQYDEIIK